METLINLPSHFAPRETVERLEAAIQAQGMQIFARIDHAAAVAEVGMGLRPMELIIFGNARAGTPLMQMSPTIGLDLPLKALVWQDEAGKTWLSYLPPSMLALRHELSGNADQIVTRMTAAFDAVIGKAVNP